MIKNKIITWESPSGDKIKAKIDIEKSVIDDITDLDGHKINLGRIPYDSLRIKIYCNDKFISKSHYCPTTEIPEYYKKNGCFAKIKNVGIREKQYNEIMNFIVNANKSMLTFEYLQLQGIAFAKSQKEIEQMKKDYINHKKQIKNGLCSLCGTFCYGDCTANYVP